MEPLSDPLLGARRTGLLFVELPSAALSVRGKDRVPFLHSLLSNDIKGLAPGQARAACLLDRQGKILFYCTAHARPEEILLEMDPSSLKGALAALERYHVSEAVQLSGATERFRTAWVHGPSLSTLSTPALPGPEGFAVLHPLLGMPGLELWCPRDRSEGFFGELRSACRAAGIAEAGEEAFEVLRIEAGLPRAGREITPEVILNELGREEFVSFTKGCYVGQEIVARIKHRAHPPRLLRGFLLEGPAPASLPARLLLQGSPLGTLTSCCRSPSLGRSIGLGFLSYGSEAEAFDVEGSAQGARAVPVPLPFIP